MRISDEEKEEIYEMYLSGNYYLREIAEWIGCSIIAVSKIIKEKEKGQIR